MHITYYQPQYQTQVIDLILQIQREEFGLPITLEDQPDLLNIQHFINFIKRMDFKWSIALIFHTHSY